jgi:hypothetical protein
VLGVPYEQEIITNEAQIPVMCMNPRDTVDRRRGLDLPIGGSGAHPDHEDVVHLFVRSSPLR